jgi:hypothetical protein
MFANPGCCECGEEVRNQKFAAIHDLCEQRRALERAQESIARALVILADADEPSASAAAHIEEMLSDVCPAFDWDMPITVASRKRTETSAYWHGIYAGRAGAEAALAVGFLAPDSHFSPRATAMVAAWKLDGVA